jgi:two-component system NtrC family sensor kinase
VTKRREPYETLAGKLIIATSIMLFSGSLLIGFIFFKFNEDILMKNLRRHGRSEADLVSRAIHYGMLTAQYEVMQHTLEVLATSEDILDIQVFNPKGAVVFASDPKEQGRTVKMSQPMAESIMGREPPPVTITTEEGEKLLRFLLPIRNEPSCYTAACHVHSEHERVLGVLQTDFRTTAIEITRQQMFRGTLVFGAVAVLSASLMLILIFYRFISRPVAKLELGMKRLATGDLDTPIDIQSRDEMGLLAETFNAMAQDIKRYRENMENWTQSLQEEVDKKTAEIVRAQEQMINAEKLASLGRMAAGVAHELNSPLTGILTFTHLLKDRTPPDRKQDLEDMDLIIEQSERCTKIIKGMLGFARKGASESMDIDVNELLDDTVEMVRNQVKFHNVQIWMEFVENIPPLTLDPNQLQQVFLNLLTNAADAMNDRGSISIATRVVGEDPERSVEIEFTDTGPGIYPNNLAKIFEPFFTTKPVGQGTGLGLPVSYGIVKKHGGDITVKSKVGEGTSFFVHLPLKKAGEETG